MSWFGKRKEAVTDEPMKIPMPGQASADATDENSANAGAPLGSVGSEETEAISTENQLLAAENARLAQENYLLRMQCAAPPVGETPEWFMPPMDPWGTQGFYPMPGFGYPEAQGGKGRGRQPASWPVGNRPKQGSTANRGKKGATDSFGSTGPATSFGSASFPSEEGDAMPTGTDVKPDGPCTTVMMRNIPNDYTRDMLLDLLCDKGFGKCFDLVYLPVDFKTSTGLGYAFVNLVTTEEAERFRDQFQGFSDWGMLSHKVCDVSWSDVFQGVQANIERYRNSPVMHESVPDKFKPMLFNNGERIAFPEPTKKIRAPRWWPRRHQPAPSSGAGPTAVQ